MFKYRRYERPREAAMLPWYGVVEAFAYRPREAFQAQFGLIEYLRGDTPWGEMIRVGVETQ